MGALCEKHETFLAKLSNSLWGHLALKITTIALFEYIRTFSVIKSLEKENTPRPLHPFDLHYFVGVDMKNA